VPFQNRSVFFSVRSYYTSFRYLIFLFSIIALKHSKWGFRFIQCILQTKLCYFSVSFIYSTVRAYRCMQYTNYGESNGIQNWFLTLKPLFFLLLITNQATFFDRNWTDHELHAAHLKESLCLFDGRGMFVELDCRSLGILSAVIKTVGNTIWHSLSINT
jgi:hypothetical protein